MFHDDLPLRDITYQNGNKKRLDRVRSFLPPLRVVNITNNWT